MTREATMRVSALDGRVVGRRFSIMLRMRVERWDLRRDGPLTEAALLQKIEALGYDATPRSYPAGTMSPGQSDPVDRVQGVVRGLIKIVLDGEPAILGAGDIVFVPAGAVRRVEAIGASTALCFEAVRRPRP